MSIFDLFTILTNYSYFVSLYYVYTGRTEIESVPYVKIDCKFGKTEIFNLEIYVSAS